MPKVDEVYFRSPSRKLGINDEDIKNKTLKERRAKRAAAKVASEKLSKVRSQQGSARQEGLVKQGSIGPQIDVGQVASNIPTTPEQDTQSGTFKGKGTLGGTRAIEKGIREAVRQVMEDNPDLSMKEARDIVNRNQLKGILDNRPNTTPSPSGVLHDSINFRAPNGDILPARDQLAQQGERGNAPAGGIRFRGDDGNILPPQAQLSQQQQGDISGPLSEQIKSNLALQSQQQARDFATQRETIQAQAEEMVKSGKADPKQVNQGAAKVAEGNGATKEEAVAAGNKAEKDFKIFGMDGKQALLASVGIGLAGLAIYQDPRGAAKGLPGAIDAFNQPEKDRLAGLAAGREEDREDRKLGQGDRALDIREKLGLGALNAQKAKLSKGTPIKPSDRPTISEAAANETVKSFVDENLSELDLTDENMADLSLQLREMQKSVGGSPIENLQKIILEQFTVQTDPGIFFDDNNLIRK